MPKKRRKNLSNLWRTLLRSAKDLGLNAADRLTKNKKFKQFNNRFLRRLVKFRKKRSPRGFVLPTVIFLIVIAGLLIGSMLLRSSNRAIQTIGDRNSQTIVNAATPAIDRAKAKLEYLFKGDTRFPSGLPSDYLIETMLLNTANPPLSPDPYDLSDEVRLDIDGDGVLDNAWAFQQDVNGDGKVETVAYEILSRTSNTYSGSNTPAGTTNGVTYTRTDTDLNKANNKIVRGGSITLDQSGSGGCGTSTSLAAQLESEAGWDSVTTATLVKSFVINAIVIRSGDSSIQRTLATLSLQQNRQYDLGNKWGAWFRSDISMYNEPNFNWNGAMHTEGNLMFDTPSSGATFTAYLISSPSSCLYSQANSQITIAGNLAGNITTAAPYLGQVVAGSLYNNSISSSSTSIWNIYSPTGPAATSYNLTSATDSVIDSSILPEKIAVDPVVIQTQNLSQTRSSYNGSSDGSTLRSSNWNSQLAVTGGRIFNTSATEPYVDDTYRADNLYGPKSAYSSIIPTAPNILPSSGNQIQSGDTYYTQLTNLTTTDPATNEGLDGYWERRAWAEGLRIIVGQRLELGDYGGWKKPSGDTISPDPLYPAISANPDGRSNEHKQWKSLRDNLASVQSAAIYHASSSNTGGFPTACLSLAAHPGTTNTISNSTTFATFPATSNIQTDFLIGKGTNGWEFNPPSSSSSAFISSIASGQPLYYALSNLANFAGDPKGAFPPQQDGPGGGVFPATSATSNTVHPYPYLSMWGDFSNLRRIMTALNSGTTYVNLSLADQTTLQTASCTLGMLAYNLDSYQTSYTAALSGTMTTGQKESANPTLGNTSPQTSNSTAYITSSSPTASLSTLGSGLYSLMDGVGSDIGLDSSGNGALCTVASVSCSKSMTATYTPSYYKQFTARQWLDALNILQGGTATTTLTSTNSVMIYGRQLLAQIQPYEQIMRDRALGFSRSANVVTISPNSNNYDSSTGTYTNSLITGNKFSTICNPDLFSTGTPKYNLALAQAFCSPGESPYPNTTYTSAQFYPSFSPKYPALFYLFPRVDHYQYGTTPSYVSSPNTNLVTSQSSTGESFITDPYVTSSSVNGSTSGVIFYSIGGGGSSGGGVSDVLTFIEVQPRTRANWQLPNVNNTSITGSTPNVNTITDSTSGTAISAWVPFLDKGIFNGREMMGVRVLDIDIDKLRQSTANLTNDSWLPYTGEIYVFREDAMREDGIARPSGTSFANCSIATKYSDTSSSSTHNSACLMSAFTTPQDPPLNSTTGVSPKPVDFYPDPDRRPYGFRLRNGADLRRIPHIPSSSNYVYRGITLASDNPVYVMADSNNLFNLHSNAASGAVTSTNNMIGEFTQLLNGNYSNFYTRTTLNPNFASITLSGTTQTSGDTWRVAEILSDAITILPSTFVDGTIADGLVQSNCGGTNPSYCSLNSPSIYNNVYWVREDLSASNSVSANMPILISRNGDPVYCVTSAGNYITGAISSNSCINPTSFSGSTSTYRLQEYGKENVATSTTGDTPSPITYSKSTLCSFNNCPYNTFATGKYLATGVNNTYMNFTVVSGITPGRAYADFGGLHNFPRFLNDWGNGGYALYLSGSFIQLNYSTQGTGIFSGSSWEPTGLVATNDTSHYYYTPPARYWGYDVGLQYVPAGPVAARFTTASPTGSESYYTLSAEDPYIRRMRCASIPTQAQMTSVSPSSNLTIPSVFSSLIGTKIDPFAISCNF